MLGRNAFSYLLNYWEELQLSPSCLGLRMIKNPTLFTIIRLIHTTLRAHKVLLFKKRRRRWLHSTLINRVLPSVCPKLPQLIAHRNQSLALKQAHEANSNVSFSPLFLWSHLIPCLVFSIHLRVTTKKPLESRVTQNVSYAILTKVLYNAESKQVVYNKQINDFLISYYS